jgi:3-oxoacyl-[acyl-carrier protein] reductase
MPGPVVLGGSGRLGGTLADITSDAAPGDRPAALVYDGTGLESPAALRDLYEFVHSRIRSLAPAGRVLVIGDAIPGATQAALEGFTRSLGKELRAGSTSQLLRVAPGGDEFLESPVRFFLSPRSAYISGQVIVVEPGRVPQPVDLNASFSGKKAAVTGAARGIGAAIAGVLAVGGAEVICIDLPAQAGPLGELADRIGGTAIPLDITQTMTTIDSLKEHGPLDVFVHNAGITRDRTIAAMRPDEWDPVLGVNLAAVVEITDGLTADPTLLTDGGAIVCVSSIAGIAGNRGQTNYGASKAGVIGLVRAGAPRGIRINAVAPGFIQTEMTARMPLLVREVGRRMNSLGQAGLPVDVAEAVGWLAAPATSGVTGQVLRVCGQSLLGA